MLGRSTDAVVSTKVGRSLEPNDSPNPGDDLEAGFAVPARWTRRWDFTRDGVLRSLDESRRRLGRDRIDVVFIHDPDDHMDEALDSALPTLVELRDAGVVGAIGAGMNSAPLLARFVETGVVDVVLLAGRYTLLEQDALDDLLPAAIEHGVSVVIGGVFNSGILTRDDVSADALYNYAPGPGATAATSPPARHRVPGPPGHAAGRGDAVPTRPPGRCVRAGRRGVGRARRRGGGVVLRGDPRPPSGTTWWPTDCCAPTPRRQPRTLEDRRPPSPVGSGSPPLSVDGRTGARTDPPPL